jgi:hypothetical protein
MNIEKKPIPDFTGYLASRDGKVFSLWSRNGTVVSTETELKPDTIRGGYLRVRLRSEKNVYTHRQVAHLVLLTFVGQRPFTDAVACHRDGNPKNNSLDNLRWDTRSSNEDDKKLIGTHQTGENNPASKLTEIEVREIRNIRDTTSMTMREIGDLFGVTRSAIKAVCQKRNWKHVV